MVKWTQLMDDGRRRNAPAIICRQLTRASQIHNAYISVIQYTAGKGKAKSIWSPSWCVGWDGCSYSSVRLKAGRLSWSFLSQSPNNTWSRIIICLPCRPTILQQSPMSRAKLTFSHRPNESSIVQVSNHISLVVNHGSDDLFSEIERGQPAPGEPRPSKKKKKLCT